MTEPRAAEIRYRVDPADVHEREHDQRRSAQAGVHKRGDDRARLSFGGFFNAE
jgi:hypothetical protein